MKKIIAMFLSVIIGLSFISAPAFAVCSDEQLNNGCVNTSILGENGCSCKSDETAEHGEGIMNILNLVVDIMTIGIGILGVIGISIVGVQYLTAGGNEEKTRKAKRRMLEIIIGLVAYALIYALLKFLGVQPN